MNSDTQSFTNRLQKIWKYAKQDRQANAIDFIASESRELRFQGIPEFYAAESGYCVASDELIWQSVFGTDFQHFDDWLYA